MSQVMRDLAILFIHLIVTLARLLRPGGTRAVVAESLLTKHQLLVLTRSRRRSPPLKPADRVIAGLCALLMRPARIYRSAIVLKPATIPAFHQAPVKRKRRLFSSKRRGKPGRKGPAAELINAIVEMKRRNPRWGCPRIARQLALAFGVDINKDVVRRVLARHYRPDPATRRPSWLTFLGHTKDSLWSVDLFLCESLTLRSHWVLVVMDQFTRAIIGFGVHAGYVDRPALCRMFNNAVAGHDPPKYLSSDHDPLFRFRRWRANLRVLDVLEVKTVPYVPLSHPFVERLIGTVRREYLDYVPFWNTSDLQRKLSAFQDLYNRWRAHSPFDPVSPEIKAGGRRPRPLSLANYQWQPHCRGLFHLPTMA